MRAKWILFAMLCSGLALADIKFECEAKVEGNGNPDYHWPIRVPVLGIFGMAQEDYDKVIEAFDQCHRRCDKARAEALRDATEKLRRCSQDVGDKNQQYCQELVDCGMGQHACAWHECGAKCNIAYHRTVKGALPPTIHLAPGTAKGAHE
jgi:hypothetical protein